ncbi:hypothetical protein H6F87_25525 [Cyanobacteria bacterium FACHB-502]|nr:hypothetical protein [Cyanobacteria bacterium FACHB-502]
MRSNNDTDCNPERFTIFISDCEVDVTPNLWLSVIVDNHILKLILVNSGWGTAHNCQVQVSEPTLNKLFPGLAEKVFQVDVRSGESQTIAELDERAISRTILKNIQREFSDISDNYPNIVGHSKSNKFSVLGIKIERIEVSFRFTDENGKEYELHRPMGTTSSREKGGRGYRCELAFTDKGFTEFLQYIDTSSDDPLFLKTSAALLDPLQKDQTRSYVLDSKYHRIFAGYPKKFSLVLTSEKTCKCFVQFRFELSNGEAIESEKVELTLRNSTELRLHERNYKDGEQIKRELAQLSAEVKDTSESWLKHRLERMKQRVSTYPFLCHWERTEHHCIDVESEKQWLAIDRSSVKWLL